MNIDILSVVHGTGASSGPLSVSAGVYGDSLCAAGTQFSNLELDFGAPLAGTSFPYIPQFPSLTEKTYTFPPEVMGAGGVDFGLHILVGQTFLTLTSILFNVCSAATTAATAIIAARSLTLAQLVAGQHYFIPVNPAAVLEFLRFQAVLTGSNATAGTVVAWFGPSSGGEL
jgi:hypothetical protein